MIHKIIYENKAYEVDDSKFFDEQNESCKNLCNNVSKTVFSGFVIVDVGTTSIVIYDKGGVSVIIREEEEDGK